jgi:hypothetical protein
MVQMDKEDVLDGFFLYPLIMEWNEKDRILILPHDASSQNYGLNPFLWKGIAPWRELDKNSTIIMHVIYAFILVKIQMVNWISIFYII